MPESRGAETIVAFDFGLRRIGVAVGQRITGTATPVGAVANRADGPDHERIAAVLAEWQPDRLVVGMPVHADGTPSEMTEKVERFIEDLVRYGLPVATVDERYTSQEAGSALRNARQRGSRGRIRREHVDAAAAVLIAERFLEE
jgi:putative Holliday junction resolvase